MYNNRIIFCKEGSHKMIRKINEGVFYQNGALLSEKEGLARGFSAADGKKKTISYRILSAHNLSGNDEKLKIRFDAMASHDITYVGIIQTSRAGGLEEFPLPYVLTNCHNSLCAVGGTINEDDHVFGLSAAEKYGGVFVPPHQAVIHAYMREMMSGCGKMILGSDSHTRYGALGTMAFGEGGPELVKQLLKKTYDIDAPKTVAVRLTGSPRPGVGPQDVALALIGAVFADGFVKNRVLEFVGDGIANLPIEFRNGIDVMTTETACLSSIWETDEQTRDYLAQHGRPDAYCRLSPEEGAYYDCAVEIDLSAVECMIAMPFHPSLAYTIADVEKNAGDILREAEKRAAEQLGAKDFVLTDKLRDGQLYVDQGIIAGCAGGTYDNLCAAASVLKGYDTGDGAFSLSVYPASQPVNLALMQNGVMQTLLEAGVIQRTAFCGPCFGAGDVPCNKGFSIRHSTRNFPSREGAKPGAGQIASVALMDARSIAATARNHGRLTAATELDVAYEIPAYTFDGGVYEKRCYNGIGKPQHDAALRFGPNITDWPVIDALEDNLLMTLVSEIHDPVTTTDELIPSGETSSYRSNPQKLAEFTLSRKDPGYVARAKAVLSEPIPDSVKKAAAAVIGKTAAEHLQKGSVIYARKPGDGSAREQAASCQRVLGGCANIAQEYATKRYRSNLINWGMLPLLFPDEELPFALGDRILLTGLLSAVENGTEICGYVLRDGEEAKRVTFRLGSLTPDEKKIILAGCLVNSCR